jgi:predicted MFS family arabinose efflux permease
MRTTRPPTPPRPAVRRLAAARIISITGGAAAYIALNFTVYERTGSATWVAAALLLTFGVTGLIGPIAGVLGDRYDRRKVLIASDLAGAVCFALMALGEDPAWLLAWAFLSAVVEAPFWSASEAAIPNVAGEQDLSWANSLLGMSRSAGITLGPALGGALVAAIGPRAVFAVNAVSFVASAVIVWSVRARFNADRVEEREHGELRAGIVFLARDRVLRLLMLAWLVFIAGMGMSMVADVPLAEEFDAGAIGYGLLIAGWGGGSVLGALLGRYMRQGQEGTWLAVAAAVMAAIGIGMSLSPWFSVIVVLSFLFGLADGTTMVGDQNLRQRRAPDHVRSRVAAAFMGALHLLLALSYVAAAIVVPRIGARPTYALGGVSAALAVPVLLRMRRYLREDEAATEPTAKPAEPEPDTALELERAS